MPQNPWSAYQRTRSTASSTVWTVKPPDAEKGDFPSRKPLGKTRGPTSSPESKRGISARSEVLSFPGSRTWVTPEAMSRSPSQSPV